MIEKTWTILLVASFCVFNSLLHSEFERERQSTIRLSFGGVFGFGVIFHDHSFIKLRVFGFWVIILYQITASIDSMHSPPYCSRKTRHQLTPMSDDEKLSHSSHAIPVPLPYD
jgi:hypothetical protein